MLKLQNLGNVQVEKMGEQFVVTLEVGETRMMDQNLDMEMVLSPFGVTRIVLDSQLNAVEDDSELVFISSFAMATIGTDTFLEAVEGVRERILTEVSKIDNSVNFEHRLFEVFAKDLAEAITQGRILSVTENEANEMAQHISKLIVKELVAPTADLDEVDPIAQEHAELSFASDALKMFAELERQNFERLLDRALRENDRALFNHLSKHYSHFA